MVHRGLLALAMACLLGGLAPARAELVPGTPEYATAIAAGDMVLGRVREWAAKGACPAAQVGPAAPLLHIPSADPEVKQVLYVRVAVRGCDDLSVYNFLAMTRADGAQRVQPVLAGSTQANPILQQDVLKPLVEAVQAQRPECRQVTAKSGRFDGATAVPDAARQAQPWSETWFVIACDRLWEVPMTFTPTDQGTRYEAHVERMRPAAYAPGDLRAN